MAQKTTVSTERRKQHFATPSIEITQGIREDHQELKKLIETLSDEEESTAKKRKAFVEFADLLNSHAVSEEKTIYAKALKQKKLNMITNEAFIEHRLAKLLLADSKKKKAAEVWEAEVKVLAELVKHHLEEEESEFLPKVKKVFSLEERKEIGEQFLKLRKSTQVKVAKGQGGVLSNRKGYLH